MHMCAHEVDLEKIHSTYFSCVSLSLLLKKKGGGMQSVYLNESTNGTWHTFTINNSKLKSILWAQTFSYKMGK